MRIRYNSKEIDILARIMRAEAVGEGVQGMQLVGNVVVNRVVYKCSPFKRISTIEKAVYQKNQFDGIKIGLFKAGSNSKERKSALRCIKFWRAYPAYAALYFVNPGRKKKCKKYFYGYLEGRYKNHCFYRPEKLCNL